MRAHLVSTRIHNAKHVLTAKQPLLLEPSEVALIVNWGIIKMAPHQALAKIAPSENTVINSVSLIANHALLVSTTTKKVVLQVVIANHALSDFTRIKKLRPRAKVLFYFQLLFFYTCPGTFIDFLY
jgi:hypothetical protein